MRPAPYGSKPRRIAARICIRTTGPTALHDIDAAGGIVAHYKSIELYGADQSTWTTEVTG